VKWKERKHGYQQKNVRSIAGRLSLVALVVVMATATPRALATPQESATFTNVNSDDNGTTQGSGRQPGGPGNGVVTATFSGVYTAGKITISGNLHDNGVGSFASEAQWYVQPPTGPGMFLTALTTSTSGFGDLAIAAKTFNLPPGGVPAAGTWTFRSYETFDDAGVDSKWNTVTFTLDDAMPGTIQNAGGASPAWTEVEGTNGNSSIFSYNYINGLAVGDTITGNSTGSTTGVTSAVATSADFYRLKLAAQTPGIYKNVLTLTSTIPGHTAILSGHGQLADTGAGNTGGNYTGYIDGLTDAITQSYNTVGTNRVNQFYSFGGGEMMYKVSGIVTTTANYVITLTQSTVTPITVSGSFSAGNITITRAGTNTNTCDAVLLDSNYNPVATANRHGFTTTGLVRSLTAGTYYLGISNANTSNDKNSPSDSPTRTNNVLDFNGCVMNSVTTTAADMNVTISDGVTTTTSVGGAKAAAFDIAWYTFTVVPPPVPTGVASFSPANTAQGCQSTLSVVVTPAAGQPNNGIASVLVDLTPINASLPNNFALTDGGSGTWSGAVSVPGNTTTGNKTVTCTMTDNSARVGTCQGTLTVTPYLSGTGAAAPASVLSGGTSLLTVTVNQAAGTCTLSTGITVTADLSTIGGSPTQALTDTGDGIHFTYNATVTATDGAKTLPVSISDAQGRTASTSIALQVGYCAPQCTGFSCGVDEYIGNVTIGSINNTSACVAVPGFENFTAQSTTVNPNSVVPISVLVKTWFNTDSVTVFCDWDQNLVLNDTGEVTTLTDTTASGVDHLYAGNITVPPGATLGNTRLRVRLNFGANPGPCANTTYGNNEDYTLVVALPVNPTGVGTFAPSTVPQGCDTVLSVTVTPAPGQPNNGIASVLADLSTINASLPNNYALIDGGSGTWSGTVSVPGNTTTGNKTVVCTITDNSARVGTCNATVTVGPYLSASGAAAPATVLSGGSSLLTVTVNQAAGTCTLSTGMTVTADLSTIGGSPSQALTDSGDGIHFTYNATVTATDGAKTLPVSISDAQGRTASTSIALQVGYCASASTSTGFEYFRRIVIGTIDNSPSGTPRSNYFDYTGSVTPTDLTIGVGAPFDAYNGYTTTYTNDVCHVFVDWDHNGDFTGANESFLCPQAPDPPNVNKWSGVITPPPAALLGLTRMRVKMVDESVNAPPNGSDNPCGSFTYGEVEDYLVNVVAGAVSVTCSAGDMDLDGDVDGLDIQKFVDVLTGANTNPTDVCDADVDGDALATVADVGPMIGRALGAAANNYTITAPPAPACGGGPATITINPVTSNANGLLFVRNKGAAGDCSAKVQSFDALNVRTGPIGGWSIAPKGAIALPVNTATVQYNCPSAGPACQIEVAP